MSPRVFGDVGLVGYSLQGQSGITYFLVLVILSVGGSAAGLVRSQCATPTRFQKTRFGMSHSVFGDVDLEGYSLQGQSGITYFLVLVILGVGGSAVGSARSVKDMWLRRSVGQQTRLRTCFVMPCYIKYKFVQHQQGSKKHGLACHMVSSGMWIW